MSLLMEIKETTSYSKVETNYTVKMHFGAVEKYQQLTSNSISWKNQTSSPFAQYNLGDECHTRPKLVVVLKLKI